METLFENKYARDKSTAKEIYGYWFFKKPLMIFVYVMLGVYALSCILGFIFDPEGAGELVLPFILLVFCCAAMLISYLSQVKNMVRRDAEMAKGGELLCEVSVSDSEITFSALESRQSVSLEKIKYAFATKNYISVVTEARLMYILKKDSFTLGDAERFIAFLKEKQIKIKK